MAEATNSLRASNAPPPKPERPREALVSSLDASSQVTRELRKAHDDVQDRLLELHDENKRLRAILEAQDPIRELIARVELLEREKRALAARLAETPNAYEYDPPGLEAELTNFANLHVATNRLHGTLSPRGVNRRIKEVLEQLVGVDAYVIYLSGPGGLQPIRAEGLHQDESPGQTPAQRLVEVVTSGISSILHDHDPSLGCAKVPPVVIPLSIDDHVVGVLSLVRFLSHKHSLDAVDFDLFKLVGQHAAAALMAAGLYADAGRSFPTADAFHALKH